jgi:hypothetical protein
VFLWCACGLTPSLSISFLRRHKPRRLRAFGIRFLQRRATISPSGRGIRTEPRFPASRQPAPLCPPINCPHRSRGCQDWKELSSTIVRYFSSGTQHYKPAAISTLGARRVSSSKCRLRSAPRDPTKDLRRERRPMGKRRLDGFNISHPLSESLKPSLALFCSLKPSHKVLIQRYRVINARQGSPGPARLVDLLSYRFAGP